MNDSDSKGIPQRGMFQSPKPTPPKETHEAQNIFKYAFVSDCSFPHLSEDERLTKLLDESA